MNTQALGTELTSDKALDLLREGNLRFVSNIRMNRNFHEEVEATKEGQEPFAVVISCMDSRTSPELVFDRGLGDIFSIRLAGNVVTPEVIGSVEYACAAVGSKAVVVLGHTGCGAIKGTLAKVQLGKLPTITARIAECISDEVCPDVVTEKNVLAGMRALEEESTVLRELLHQEKIKIIGGIYDITTGKVSFMDHAHPRHS